MCGLSHVSDMATISYALLVKKSLNSGKWRKRDWQIRSEPGGSEGRDDGRQSLEKGSRPEATPLFIPRAPDTTTACLSVEPAIEGRVRGRPER